MTDLPALLHSLVWIMDERPGWIQMDADPKRLPNALAYARAYAVRIEKRRGHPNMTTGLKRDNHFLPVCYQKGFADSSGKVWVKFANQGKAVHCHPRCVGKEWNLYIRTTGDVEDDKFEDFFNEQVENDFARLTRRVKRDQNGLTGLPGKELGALGKFVASQTVRTLANKQCMEEQIGRGLNTNEFLTEMGKQMKAMMQRWKSDPPAFDFYTSLPYLKERFITGDNPVLVVQEFDNAIWTPTENPRQVVAAVEGLLDNPKTSFRVAVSPYICVYLRVNGGGEAHLPPQTMEASEVRSFNDLIRKQCHVFTLAKDKASLA